MDQAIFYAVMVGGAYSLCVLVVLNNVPIAIAGGAVTGCLALVRGMRAWG